MLTGTTSMYVCGTSAGEVNSLHRVRRRHLLPPLRCRIRSSLHSSYTRHTATLKTYRTRRTHPLLTLAATLEPAETCLLLRVH